MKSQTLLLSSALVLAGASTQAAQLGDVAGTSEADIRAYLEGNGYSVQNLTVEDDEIEVDVLFDGAALEIEISSTSGAIVEIEAEDDDQDDDDEKDYSDDD